MGLDITAVSNANKIATYGDDFKTFEEIEHMLDNGAIWTYVESYFKEQADSIEHQAVYEYEDSYGFRAGSYGYYNNWRKWLADVGGYTPAQAHEGGVNDVPFIELVFFSDCEGVIGPDTALKLYNDFVTYEEKAKELSDSSNTSVFQLYDKYRLWKEACRIASKNGFIQFH